MSNHRVSFLHRLSALLTLLAFACATLPAPGSLSHPRERIAFPQQEETGASRHDYRTKHCCQPPRSSGELPYGIPLTVTRIYDSREHCAGDFGHGWRLDLDSIRLELNEPAGTGWDLAIDDGNFIRPAVYHLADTVSHVASVRMPGGETLRFTPKLVFDRPFSGLLSVLDADGDDVAQAWVPLSGATRVKLICRARGGTQGATLAPRGYSAASDSGTTTVPGNFPFFPSAPFGGELLLATADNTALDAPIMSNATGWTLTLRDGRVFLFDGTGRLAAAARDRSAQPRHVVHLRRARQCRDHHRPARADHAEHPLPEHHAPATTTDPAGPAAGWRLTPPRHAP